MRGVRRRSRWVAASWLVLQLLVTATVPVVLYASTPHHSAVECTCEHPTGGVCPMHRHSTNTPSPSAGCSLRNALDPLDALVSSIIGPTGVLPSFITSIASPEASARPSHIERTPLDRFASPDSPPPRL